MSLKFEISGAQIDGARDYQEDSFLISYLQAGEKSDQVSLAIVADGMGGHAAGNVASNLAVQSFNKYITTHYPADSIQTLLKEAVDEANNAIAKTISETPALKGMGCTLIAVLCINDKLYWISVGDSHLYHIKEKQLVKRNADHSYGGYLDRMAAEGNEVNEDNGYSRHMLLSALTGEPIPAIDCPNKPVILHKGEQLILCSDGLDTLESDSILTSCYAVDNAKKLTEKLLRDVENAQQPRQDNTTVISIKITDSSNIRKAATTNKSQPSISTQPPSSPVEKSYVQKKQGSAPRVAIEKKYRDQPRNKVSILPGVLSMFLIASLVVGGWWYMSNKRVIIPEILQHGTNEPVSADVADKNPDTEADQDNNTQFEVPTTTTTPDIVKFKDKLTKGGDAPEMVWIPEGTFEMGGTGSTPPVNERPRHKVTLKEFAISSKEITRGEFARFSGISVSKTNENQPVRNVSWKVAKKYVAWLSRQTGQAYRLPTEAEWEYAARAGTTSPYWWGYKIGNNNALCFGCGIPLEPTRPNDTGSFAPNAFGLYDTAGNVAEWVEDCYHGNYEGAPTDGSAWITNECKERVLRGGSYLNAAKSLQVSRRDKLSANKSENNIGFRVAREK